MGTVKTMAFPGTIIKSGIASMVSRKALGQCQAQAVIAAKQGLCAHTCKTLSI
jgi:hypothetical protein